tara:strand:- start:17238 stop:18638 length:1401 start_codon:yes stop_codon:yes gene_type:complete
MSEVSFSNLFHPGQRFIEGAYQSSLNKTDFILSNGIVLDVLRDVNFDKESTKVLPQYSIKAKIIGEGVLVEQEDDVFSSSEVDDWYVPLLSTHTISLPEIGEEILIIRETTESDSKGYWIGRVNNSPWLSTHLVGDNNSQDALGETGLDIDVVGMNDINNDIQPERTIRNTGVPALLGDVIQQGRTRTFIRHSFSPRRSKRGILEMGIMNRDFYALRDNIATIGRTATKVIHVEKGKLSDIGSLKKVTPVAKIISTPLGTRMINDKDAVRNFIATIADETYTISLEQDAERSLNRHVLGEKLVLYEENIGAIFAQTLDKLGDVVTSIEDFLNHFLNHTHAIPEINFQIPDKEIKFRDSRRDPDTLVYQRPSVVEVDGRTISIPQPPTIKTGALRTVVKKQKINYDVISIGGESSTRFTTTPESSPATHFIDTSLGQRKNDFAEQINELTTLISNARDILSKRHYLN